MADRLTPADAQDPVPGKEYLSQAHGSTAVPRPQTKTEYIAYGISQLFSPPIMGLAALVLTALSVGTAIAWLWAGIYLVSALVAPLSFLFWQLRQGQITDLEIHLREQRRASLLVTIAGFSLAWFVLWLGRAPYLLAVMAGVGALQWIAIFLVTLHWKISVHSASATAVSLLLWRIGGASFAPLVITIPLIAWSRVRLHRHTPLQTLAGIALGGAVFLTVVLLDPHI